ncbi:PHP domain-containing protein [Beduini massiliensis]|uniref:PHP domain-containing protein n=1 Tax=Beduini massiliensis TaxID=1585974 RepID=UPI00059AA3AC|nr:PHP domain-containing protein [Beduini massiliensis]
MKIELHTHTSEGSSCAKAKAKDIIKAYQAFGADGVVITNHYSKNTYERFKEDLKNNYLKGYRNALKQAEASSLKVFLGMELNLSSHPNDYLIYGIDEDFIVKYPTIFNESLERVAEIVHHEGGVIFQAHPLRKPCEIKGADVLDGYEFNYTPFHNNYNDHLTQWVLKHQKDYPSLQYICGSDCHGLESVGCKLFEIDEPINNNKALVKALKNKKYNYFTFLTKNDD